jgi:hypothetical protein
MLNYGKKDKTSKKKPSANKASTAALTASSDCVRLWQVTQKQRDAKAAKQKEQEEKEKEERATAALNITTEVPPSFDARVPAG